MDQIKRTIIEDNELTEKLIHKISVSSDERVMYLKVDYDNGNFTIEKTFRNNFFGLEDMEITIKSLDTEQKVRKYLGILEGELENDKSIEWVG